MLVGPEPLLRLAPVPTAGLQVLPIASELGEGPLWVQDRVFWVDIEGRAVLAWEPGSQLLRRWRMPGRVGWLVALTQRPGRFLAGMEQQIVGLDLRGAHALIDPLLPLPDAPQTRLNDAKLDPAGRLWFGSMHEVEPREPLGVLRCLQPDGRWTQLSQPYRICNGPAFSADGRTMWHADSALGVIHRYALDEQGRATAPVEWKRFDAIDGVPDGMCVDAEGALWVAHWGGWRVSRFGPDGALLAEIRLPVSQVSNLCFGGPERRRLFITTARVGLSTSQLAREPLAGALFWTDVEVPGLALPAFAWRDGPESLAAGLRMTMAG